MIMLVRVQTTFHQLHETLRQLNNVHGSILDLVFSNFPSAFTAVYKADVEFNSDHDVLSFEIRLRLARSKVPNIRAYDLKRANFVKIKQQTCSKLLTVVLM